MAEITTCTSFDFCSQMLLTLYHTIPTFNTCGKENFENIVGKGENARTQHFLLFQQCYLFFPSQISEFESQLFCRLQVL